MEDVSDLIEELRPGDYNTEPNSRYNNGEFLGTWASISDVDKFFTKYNNANSYKSATRPLRLGDYVTIKDGIYNVDWMIAGFDMEHNQLAIDDTVYDNGYGICMIPKIRVTTGQWNTDNTLTGAYMSSYMNTTALPNIVTKLKNVIGSHIVRRNVLLSSSVGGGNISNAYTWTTAYATLMSIGQMNGNFASYNNKYDCGEANYKLPVFNFMELKTGYYFWSRGICSSGNIWVVRSDTGIDYHVPSASYDVRPLIYLR